MSIIHSKYVTIDTSCVEYVHPWTHSCANATCGLFLHAILESLRMYTTAYVLALLMRGKVPSKEDLKRTILGIIQSTAFLSCHAFGYSMFLCSLRKLLGNFNFLTVSFLPSFLSSFCAILIERPSRRGLLSLYVTNVASETLFHMVVWRGLVKPVPCGEVLIFCVSITWLLYFFRGNHSKDSIYTLLRFLVGPCEEQGYLGELAADEKAMSAEGVRMPASVTPNVVSRLYNAVKSHLKTVLLSSACPHPYGCLYYTLQGGAKLFAVGYGLQLCLKILLQMKRVIARPRYLPTLMLQPDTMRLGAFFGTFSALFKMLSCWQRRWRGKDSKLHALPAGLVAGLAFCFYRDNTVALYVMWKTLQMLYNAGVEKGHLPELHGANIFFHCLSTAILFHAAVLEPHNLRPSYWKFLKNISGGRINRMDRQCLDVFGMESSASLARIIARHKSFIRS